tara:strand:+ start:8 stop:187 length:180 start_codon:yes stop_codon:yes gene_type:complete
MYNEPESLLIPTTFKGVISGHYSSLITKYFIVVNILPKNIYQKSALLENTEKIFRILRQ